ncbi:MAG TPA: beta-galactosidase [Ktedonobacteraceae bacterium]|nr:beta-galactosidase [Ktedonobacteraceae bacterium]
MQKLFPSTILYGADYNPEQWPEAVWLEDMRLMKVAHVNMVTINVFAWALLEPAPDTYSFEQLDRIMDMLAEHGIAAGLATATATPPTWMSRMYPAMWPVTLDGKRLSYGSRQHYCPNSVDYRRKADALVRRLAERYGKHPALAMWHVNNEYGDHISACYCDQCAIAFRAWLKVRYKTLDALNAAWSTSFWSQRYYDWEDIIPPRLSPASNNPGQMLDYQHFMSDSLLECYQLEANILREVTPTIPITTNFIVSFKPLDYFHRARYMDIIAFDIYPKNTTLPWENAFKHDLMRSLKDGQPHLVMEQTPGQLNWMAQNPQKRPGRIRLQSWQAVAHGADGVMYFQWRQSRGGAEKFHSAIVPHEGSEHGRIFQQAAQLGAELERIAPDVVGSRIQAQVAIVMDWQNWWAVEYLPGPSDRLRYLEQLHLWYHALHGLNVAIDIVTPEHDLSQYRVVIAPLLYMLKPGVAQNLERYVAAGGTLLITFFSGIVDAHDRVILGGYPGELRKLLGIYVEEFDPWTEEMSNAVIIADGPLQGKYACNLWGEVVHLEGANALGVFASDYYAHGPALTANWFGDGTAYYLATQASDELAAKLAQLLCQQAGIESLMKVAEGLEVTRRTHSNGRNVYFILNHNDSPEQVTLPPRTFTSLLEGSELSGQVEIAERGVLILLEK